MEAQGNVRRMLCALVLGGLVLGGAVSTASAAFDLQITEIWPGNEPGENLTEDWFEITNFGDTAWTPADGTLYYDDDSADIVDAVPMGGLLSIAPGESVVFVDELADAGWHDIWDGDLTSVPQVGIYDCKGLGQGGDAVTLFIDDLAPELNLTVIDYEGYPNAESHGGQSYDVVLGAFSTAGNASGAIATTEVNDASQPAIGSPGSIPEPGTIALLGLGALVMMRRRR